MTRMSNRDLSPEEERRQGFFVAIQQEAPERILHYLVDIVDNQDWQRYGFENIVQYIEAPYDKGGIGWTRKNLRTMIHLDHRQEWDSHTRKDEYFLGRLRNARETVVKAMGEDTLTLSSHGGDRSNIIDNVAKPKQQGTSREYIIGRLKRDAPDIAFRVIDGEISARAGLRELKARQGEPASNKVSVDMANLDDIAKVIRLHLSPDQIAELIQYLVTEDE